MEIDGLDELDFQTLLAASEGRPVLGMDEKNRDTAIESILSYCGVIMGIDIPTGPNTKMLLKTELLRIMNQESKFKNLSVKDYQHAFTMAANGSFGRIEEYGKLFNLKYFMDIMNPFLLYRSRVLYQFNQWRGMEAEKLRLPAPQKIDYRPIVEQCYQEYLSGKYNFRTWHHACYDLLEEVDLIPAGMYKKFERKARQKIFGEINASLVKSERSSTYQNGQIYHTPDKLPLALGAHMQNIMDLQEVKDGKQVQKVDICAKQICMLEYFKQQALEGAEHIFIEKEGE